MIRKDAEVYRRKLCDLRDRLARDLEDLEVEGPLAKATPPHVEIEPGDRGDASVGIYEEMVNLGLVKNEEELLQEVNDALERIDRGRFGRCEVCHAAIPETRLRVIPYSRRCAGCAGTRESAV